MKKTIFALMLSSLLATANNEIYLDQSGNTGTFDIIQFGASNQIGDTDKRSRLQGENKDYDLVFVGDENILDLNNVGNGELFDFM